MSTRSLIAIKSGDVFKSIYCHYDGYPSGVGKVLNQHYTDVDKINKLIALGSISILGEHVETDQPHSFDRPVAGVTVAYHRDRLEEFDPPETNFSTAQLKAHGEHVGVDYIYWFDPESFVWNLIKMY